MEAPWCSVFRLVWLMVLEALFCKLRFRIICQMKCRVSRGNFIISIICLNFSTFSNYRTMAGNGDVLPSGVRITYVDPTPPIVPVNVAPAVPVVPVAPGPPAQERHDPLDYNLLDEVDEGVQRLNVAPLSPKSKRLQELEKMVEEQSAKHRRTVVEAQAIIDRANEETRAMQRERDGARSAAPLQAPLSALPVPFEFGGFRSNPPARSVPAPVPPPHHPSPSSPPVGFGSFGSVRGGGEGRRDLMETPFLSAKGSLLSHVELSREVRMSREQKEESKRGTGLTQQANKRVDAELIDLQTTFLQVQAQLDEYFGAGRVPPGIQESVDLGERQLTQSRQSLRIQESHGAALAAQFRGDPLLSSEEQVRLRSLVKDQKDRLTVTKASGGGGSRRGGNRGGGQGTGGVKGGKVNPPRAKGRGATNAKYVSGSSQLIASSVCSGLASSVGSRGTLRPTAPSPSGYVCTTPPPPPVVGPLSVPLALKARGDLHFNNVVKVAEIELLERFEGGVVTEQDGLAVMFEADADIEYSLTGTLRAHLPAWRQIDAGTFALSVIENGYIPELGPMPTFYSEANNKSYRENVDFANEAVMKLLKFGVVEEVQKSSLRCVNPLTVAQNTTKKRLCIDLSRCFNEQCVAQKFKIESTVHGSGLDRSWGFHVQF